MRSQLYAVALLSFFAACRADDPAGGSDAAIDAAPGPDGPDGSGCAPTTPRSATPQTFVGPTGLEDRIGGYIDSAQHTLDVQMYLFNDTKLRDRIIAAHARGVAVRVILDPDEAGNSAVRPGLTSAGVPNRNATMLYAYSHAKYLIIDGTSAVIMSMNFNTGAMKTERNYGLVDQDPEDVTDLRAIFEMDWAAAGNEAARPANLACTRLVVSPDNSKPRILGLIASAKTTLDVEAQYLAETNVRQALVTAKSRGVAIRVIIEDPSEDEDSNDDPTTYFKSAGIEVKLATSSQFYLHAKLMIADGVAMVGSENYSQTSLTMNREVGVFVFEPTAVAPIQTQFDADWAATHDAP